jgi:hypothetical protein
MGEHPDVTDDGTGDAEGGEFDGWRTLSGWLWLAYLLTLAAGVALLI